jgi:hypothetical protein
MRLVEKKKKKKRNRGTAGWLERVQASVRFIKRK